MTSLSDRFAPVSGIINDSAVPGGSAEDALERLYATTQDMTIYVDDVAGDDATGDGSASSPYKTITKAYEQVPYLLRHSVAIRIKGGTYTAFPNTVHNYAERGTGSGITPAGDEGQLTFEGIDPPTSVAGPFTMTSVVRHNVAGLHVGNTIAVAGAGWTPDQYYGKFVKITSGPVAGKYFGIYSNTATDIEMGSSQSWEVISAGDTFEIVSPSVVVQTDRPVAFDCSMGAGNGTANFGAFNIMFYATTGTNFSPYVCQGNGLVIFSLVIFKMDTSDWIFNQIGGGINSNFLANTSVLVDAGHANYAQPSFMVMGKNGAVPSTPNDWVIIGGSNSIRGPIMMFGLVSRNEVNLEDSMCTLSYCLIEALDIDHRAKLQIDGRIYQQIAAGRSYGVRVDDLSMCKLHGVRFDKVNTDAILLTSGSMIVLASIDTAAAGIPGYGVRAGKMVSMVFDAAKCTLSGTTGDIYWNQTSAAVAFPVAGNSVTDGQGSRMTA